jgi:putative heme transporter
MSDKSPLRRHWKLILNIVTLVALVVIYLIRDQLASTLKNITHVNAWALLLLIPVELLNYHAQARMYQRLFKVVGNKLSYKYLYKAALELNFVNHVFPSGGVTGISYFGVRLSDDDNISGGKATLIQVMKLALTLLSFELLLIIGLVCLAAVGKVNDLTVLVAGSLSTLLLVMTVGFAYIVGSKSRIDSFFTALTRAVNRVIHFFFRKNPETINVQRAKGVFNDFHDNYQQLIAHRQELQGPFWYAFLANVTEVMAIYVVYIAFGEYVNIGAIILAYGVANFAGLVSVLPGGIGIYEALMTAVLASAGIPAAVSLPVTIMYRVLNTLIQLPPGYYLYQKALNRKKSSHRSEDAA